MGLRRFIKRKIRRIRRKLLCKKLKCQVLRSLKRNNGYSSRVVFIGSPLHGNIGDHAIALAMRSFFAREFPDQIVVEIPGEIFRRYVSVFQESIRPSDCVVVIGGGFLGTLWMNEEEMVRLIVRSFPENRIVIFPQTVFFDSSPDGILEKEVTRDLYQSHQDLHLWIRDYSIEFVKVELCGGILQMFAVPRILSFI